MAAKDVVASFAGCCGQRCMAASVLVLVGDNEALLKEIVEQAGKLCAGQDAGMVRCFSSLSLMASTDAFSVHRSGRLSTALPRSAYSGTSMSPSRAAQR